MTSSSARRLLVAVLLTALTIGAYSAAGGLGFVTWDDPIYVRDNPRVAAGPTWENVKWAFTTDYASNWHPLTWLSHMLDARLFGVTPGPHHWVNVAIHVANTLLLFFALLRMTGFVGRAAFVAALFAVHPLHVESVAWISERKDVLSTLFLLATLHAYVSYARATTRRGPRMTLVCALFAAGVMSKPMVVTLPFLLLLLDRWPLARTESTRRLVVEKTPLFALAAVGSIATLVAQTQTSAIGSLSMYSLGMRLANAAVAYVEYVARTFWPADLGAFYPFPHSLSAGLVVFAIAALVAVSALAIAQTKRRPWLFVGWFWFVGTLVPAIGVVQVGHQAMADRYTYVPIVGLFVVVAWGAVELLARLRNAAVVEIACASIVIAACAVATRAQLTYWKDGESLWRRVLDVTENNIVADNNYALIELDRGDADAAARRLAKVVRDAPDYVDALNNFGHALTSLGRPREALTPLAEAARLRPDIEQIQFNLGVAYAELDQFDEAAVHFGEAVRLKPTFERARLTFGRMLLLHERPADAAPQFVEALRIDPDSAGAHHGLALSLEALHREAEAMPEYAAAARLAPDNAAARRDFGMLLARAGRRDEAARELEAALRLDPNLSDARATLEELRASGPR